MKKLVHIFLFIGIINTLTFAEVTKEDVDRYLEVSRGGEIVKDRFTFRYYKNFPIIYGYNIKKADKQTIQKYKAFIFKPKYEDVFYKAFAKIDDASYYEIMAFYKTDLGKKYTQGFKKIYDMDIRKELMTLILESKDRLVLPKKRILVSKIYKAFNSKVYINYKKYSQELKETNVFKNKNISFDEMKLIIDEYFEVFSEFAYKDFSENELYDILAYAKTYGKIEMAFLYHALTLNVSVFKEDLEKFIKNKDKKIEQ